jgi:phage baseplate assembly protein W
MGSINFNGLVKLTNSVKPSYVYSDVHLDLTYDYKNRDIIVDYDIEAIKNAIFNIFNTNPGERFLIPTFGCNLLRYVFTPITQSNGENIGNEIYRAIRDWEPRVTVSNVNVVGYPDSNQYSVSLVVIFPNIGKSINITGVLNKTGFREVKVL